MRRALAALLAGAVACSSLPAHAALARPSRMPVSRRPTAPPRLTATAAATSASRALALPRAAAAAPPRAPARAASALASLVPAAVAARAAEPEHGSPRAAKREGNAAPRAIEELGSLAKPDADPAAFDGRRPREGAPAELEAASPSASPLKRGAGPLGRRLSKAVPTADRAFAYGFASVTGAAGAAATYWGVLPFFSAVTMTAGAIVLAADAAILLGVGRLALRLAGRARRAPSASPRRRAAAGLAGAAAALALLAGSAAHRPAVAGAVSDLASAALGPALAASGHDTSVLSADSRAAPPETAREVMELLSRNPEGRRILEGLRDRGGAIRLPTFHVAAHGPDVGAVYRPAFDAVFLSERLLELAGVSSEGFHNDPAARRRVLALAQSGLAHELQHAAQFRRSPFHRDYHRRSFEREQEAYVAQHFYEHEMLKADPGAAELGGFHRYGLFLRDVDAELRELAGSGMYESNQPGLRFASRSWTAWRERLGPGWQAHRVEGYRLLALRYRASSPARSAAYMRRAQAVAREAGLPAPAGL